MSYIVQCDVSLINSINACIRYFYIPLNPAIKGAVKSYLFDTLSNQCRLISNYVLIFLIVNQAMNACMYTYSLVILGLYITLSCAINLRFAYPVPNDIMLSNETLPDKL